MDIEDDFDVVEKIVCIFEKYNIDAGGRHNFWLENFANKKPSGFHSAFYV